MNDFRPIETKYKGYRFRSRLEARWAVFFDALGTAWKYEDEGFHLPNGEQYLPDFWLPQIEIFAEIKGKEFTPAELERCRLLAQHTGHTVIMLDGTPDLRMYPVYIGTSGKQENQAFDSDKYRIDMAVDAARSARFEHGEVGLPVVPVPIVVRSPRHRAGEIAERELIRALLLDRSRIEVIAEKVGPESFTHSGYRSIFVALLAFSPNAPLGDLVASLDEEAWATVEGLISDDSTNAADRNQIVKDALERLHVRDMEDRVMEIDRVLPTATDDEKDALSEEKQGIIREMRLRGRSRFVAFRRGRGR